MFGYPHATVNGVPVLADVPSGHSLGDPVGNRYPWRLVPYVGNIWEILHSHAEMPDLPAPGDSYSDALNKAYILSLSPTFGINATYIGGDKNYDGFVGDKPNVGQHVVFHESEVISPSNLITFTDSKLYGPGFGAGEDGLHFVTPPRARGHRWQATDGKVENLMVTSVAGLPEGWYTDATTTGFFDGHVDMLKPEELEDMRLWANWADSPTYDFSP